MITSALRVAIENKLLTLSGAGQPLAQVKKIPSEDITGFPVAMVRPSSGASSFFTNTDNFRTYEFQIAVIQEMENVGHEKAYDILSNVVDILVPAFDKDISLGGVSDFNDPIEWDWDVDNIGNGAAAYVIFTLRCKKEEDVTAP